jgi:hypothetical protein
MALGVGIDICFFIYYYQLIGGIFKMFVEVGNVGIGPEEEIVLGGKPMKIFPLFLCKNNWRGQTVWKRWEQEEFLTFNRDQFPKIKIFRIGGRTGDMVIPVGENNVALKEIAHVLENRIDSTGSN